MSTIIVDAVVISYDINASHNEVKASLRQQGWMEAWSKNDRDYYMPNTTLWKQRTSTTAGIQDLTQACRALGVTIERAVAVAATDVEGY